VKKLSVISYQLSVKATKAKAKKNYTNLYSVENPCFPGLIWTESFGVFVL